MLWTRPNNPSFEQPMFQLRYSKEQVHLTLPYDQQNKYARNKNMLKLLYTFIMSFITMHIDKN